MKNISNPNEIVKLVMVYVEALKRISKIFFYYWVKQADYGQAYMVWSHIVEKTIKTVCSRVSLEENKKS